MTYFKQTIHQKKKETKKKDETDYECKYSVSTREYSSIMLSQLVIPKAFPIYTLFLLLHMNGGSRR